MKLRLLLINVDLGSLTRYPQYYKKYLLEADQSQPHLSLVQVVALAGAMLSRSQIVSFLGDIGCEWQETVFHGEHHGGASHPVVGSSIMLESKEHSILWVGSGELETEIITVANDTKFGHK